MISEYNTMTQQWHKGQIIFIGGKLCEPQLSVFTKKFLFCKCTETLVCSGTSRRDQIIVRFPVGRQLLMIKMKQ